MHVLKLIGLLYTRGRVKFPQDGYREDNSGHVAAALGVKTQGLEAKPLQVVDVDFVAEFDGEHWVMRWCWKGDVPFEL